MPVQPVWDFIGIDIRDSPGGSEGGHRAIRASGGSPDGTVGPDVFAYPEPIFALLGLEGPSSRQLVEYGLGLLQVQRVKALGEPAVNRSQ